PRRGFRSPALPRPQINGRRHIISPRPRRPLGLALNPLGDHPLGGAGVRWRATVLSRWRDTVYFGVPRRGRIGGLEVSWAKLSNKNNAVGRPKASSITVPHHVPGAACS